MSSLNPWLVEQEAKYRRQQIRDDLKQIRLAQKALRPDPSPAHPARSGRAPAGLLRRATRVLAQAILAMMG